jgi:hypothetical protein
MDSRGQLALPPEKGNLCQYTGATRLRLPLRILVVDDHFVVRLGLTAVLNAEADLRVVAEVEGGFAAIDTTYGLKLHPYKQGPGSTRVLTG